MAKRQKNVEGGRRVQRLVKMTDEQALVIDAAAESLNMGVPEYLITTALQSRGVESDEDRSRLIYALGRVEYQLAKLGNNVNQIAHRLNATGTLDAGAAETLAEVRKQIREVQSVAQTVQRTRIS